MILDEDLAYKGTNRRNFIATNIRSDKIILLHGRFRPEFLTLIPSKFSE